MRGLDPSLFRSEGEPDPRRRSVVHREPPAALQPLALPGAADMPSEDFLLLCAWRRQAELEGREAEDGAELIGALLAEVLGGVGSAASARRGARLLAAAGGVLH